MAKRSEHYATAEKYLAQAESELDQLLAKFEETGAHDEDLTTIKAVGFGFLGIGHATLANCRVREVDDLDNSDI